MRESAQIALLAEGSCSYSTHCHQTLGRAVLTQSSVSNSPYFSTDPSLRPGRSFTREAPSVAMSVIHSLRDSLLLRYSRTARSCSRRCMIIIDDRAYTHAIFPPLSVPRSSPSSPLLDHLHNLLTLGSLRASTTAAVSRVPRRRASRSHCPSTSCSRP